MNCFRFKKRKEKKMMMKEKMDIFWVCLACLVSWSLCASRTFICDWYNMFYPLTTYINLNLFLYILFHIPFYSISYFLFRSLFICHTRQKQKTILFAYFAKLEKKSASAKFYLWANFPKKINLSFEMIIVISRNIISAPIQMMANCWMKNLFRVFWQQQQSEKKMNK